MSQERNEKKVRQKAETKDGRKVTNLVRNEFGYFGTVDNVRVMWDMNGISGKGDSWTLQFKD
jgi:hypothetical protein